MPCHQTVRFATGAGKEAMGPEAYAQLLRSALKAPCAPAGGRQATTAATTDFQQFWP